MLMDLAWDIMEAPVGVMCRWQNTFVHIMHLCNTVHRCLGHSVRDVVSLNDS